MLLRRSLTWDQGTEPARHVEITKATGVPIFFCDPASPWQRGSNEDTNGLLRQYFPKGTDLNAHSAQRLLEVATELNERPRKTLKRSTPADLLRELVSRKETAGNNLTKHTLPSRRHDADLWAQWALPSPGGSGPRRRRGGGASRWRGVGGTGPCPGRNAVAFEHRFCISA